MADKKISALTGATTPLAGTEVLPIVQSGTTVKVSVANLTDGRAITASSAIISGNSASNALRITQVGTGNALLVEDSANPDATPFVINQFGQLISGATQTYITTVNGVDYRPQFQIHGAAAATPAIGYEAANWATTTGAGSFSFAKSRGGVIGTHAVVNSSDSVGETYYFGSDGTNFIEAARISAQIDGTPGTNDMPGRLLFSTTADGASTPTERMRINSAGDVTIGTGNLIIGTSGKGVDFSATAGTGTSELLADYEEGTWTPVDNSGAGLTFTNDGGHYVKVGALVVATFAIIYPSTVNASAASIGGLPFQAQNTNSATYPATPSFTTFTVPFLGVIPPASFSIVFYTYGGAPITNANFSGNFLRCTAIYRVL